MKFFLLTGVILWFAWGNSFAQVTIKKEEQGLLFTEGGENILFYQKAPKNHEGEYERRHYIHPLWGLDGTILTEDFPDDHLHHRGIFWAWHQVWIGDQRIGDPWALESFEQHIAEVEFFAQSDGSGVLKSEVEWLSDQWIKNGEKEPYLKENTTITIYPQAKNYRRIDFEINLLALEKNLSIGGSEDEKGYSGFSVRMILPEDVTFSGKNGKVEPQTLAVTSPGYIDVSGSLGKEGQKVGIVIVDHPSNPGYPQPWILRAKSSMQNAAFPGRGTVPVSMSVPLTLKYSLLIHSEKMTDRQIRKAMAH
jgi:hypothetical protein